jgi:hypothetical protein
MLIGCTFRGFDHGYLNDECQLYAPRIISADGIELEDIVVLLDTRHPAPVDGAMSERDFSRVLSFIHTDRSNMIAS